MKLQELQKRTNLTLLIDGWEDLLKRSLYGLVAAQVNQEPVALGLADLTGKRGSAESIFEMAVNHIDSMGLGNGKRFICTTTDNPTMMISFRRILETKFPWLITLPCFLHQLNMTIGEIIAYSLMKKTLIQSTRIVTFFNSSHHWGGQLKLEAKKAGYHTGTEEEL
ncbi:hypothetical protein D9758_018916 [Tetrapyrgos nigripes]|uniref:DUF659 domain-containing protein n=1 Tax=Tetrapyrgos nigripes TaxID=182062 RepID=A0A8H5BSA9_9AGAR|nr:hypothetical protein D9758_018916 [Tetrapyrgos nigripes]